jgi:hypothetical protein
MVDFIDAEFFLRPISMQRLEVLVIPMFGQRIFGSLEAPSLRSVTLENRNPALRITFIVTYFPPHIQELHLDTIRLDKTHFRVPILLRNLEFLTLANVELYAAFSTYFDVPSLVELVISNVDDRIPQEDGIQNFPRGVIGPTPTLQRLWLDKVPDQDINQLSLCSSLKALRITNCNLSGDGSPFFDVLNDIGIFPNLEEVVIQHLQNDMRDSIFYAAQASAKRHRPSLRLYTGDICEDNLRHPFRFNPGRPVKEPVVSCCHDLISLC